MSGLQFAGLIAISILMFLAFRGGYDVGIEETEQRWSDAVAKSNYARERERFSTPKRGEGT